MQSVSPARQALFPTNHIQRRPLLFVRRFIVSPCLILALVPEREPSPPPASQDSFVNIAPPPTGPTFYSTAPSRRSNEAASSILSTQPPPLLETQPARAPPLQQFPPPVIEHVALTSQAPQAYQQPFPTQQMAESQPVSRAPAPRPAYPLVTFGFGGRLLTMFPRASDGAVVEHADQDSLVDTSRLNAGPIRIYQLTDLAQHDETVAHLLSAELGPLDLSVGPSQSDVAQYAQTQATRVESSSSVRVVARLVVLTLLQSLAFLWRLLSLASLHNGRTSVLSSSSLNQLDNTVRCITIGLYS